MKAVKARINGIVQGVGFRPFIYRLAKKRGLAGWVLNSSLGVELLVQGRAEDIEVFLAEIPQELPPQAVIDSMAVEPAEPEEHKAFVIKESQEAGGITRISPDIALCEDCLAEMLDKKDRRYRYPFINCTNCGPRFSIIRNTPYDRPKTTMASFAMCPDCQKEYDDPENRRFHAQPNACPVCGPRVWLGGRDGTSVAEGGEAIKIAAQSILKGLIVAVKGIGGFHLTCDATNNQAVQTLRQRKHRPHKPLALMCADLEEVRRICLFSDEEASVLSSSQAPIVLLRKIKNIESKISDLIAPGNNYLGVMLPYAPVHHLLFKELKKLSPGSATLVMTSGNVQDEPVIINNSETLEKMGGIADSFLLNDRDIENRNDDSIVWVNGNGDGDAGSSADSKPDIQIVRHSRGYAPNPITLPVSVPPSLAVGGEMKNVFCLVSGDKAYVSQHIGELDNSATMDFFEEMTAKYQKWFQIEPEIIIHDLHPDYLTTKWAQEQKNVSRRAIQHHKAHILSALADNGKMIPCIGVAFDGTGYGEDGKIWGGEFFLFDGERIERAGHLEYLPLPGGEASIRKPYRIAAAYGRHLLGNSPQSIALGKNKEELEIIYKQLENNFNLAWTSSLGRLFDAVSALLGVCQTITFEAQAAIALENCLDPAVTSRYDYQIAEGNGCKVISIQEMWRQVSEDLERGASQGVCSSKFHNTIVDFTLSMCDNLKLKSDINTVALSGGVFQNRFLFNQLRRSLEKSGYNVLIHRQVPSNDGGLALGQAVSTILN
jgi:hydrogenase maturation protein HypF